MTSAHRCPVGVDVPRLITGTSSQPWCIETFREAIVSLPESFDASAASDDRFALHTEGQLSAYYAPFDLVNSSARVALVGLTPGRHQAQVALGISRHALQEGATLDETLREAKRTAAFAGAMRTNLVSMLDQIGLTEALDLGSSAELFEHRDLLHTTSAIMYPVFRGIQNYSGSPSPLRTPFLRVFVETVLARNLRLVPDALVIPLGETVSEAIQHLIDRGDLTEHRCLIGLPHPSGANGHRVRLFRERREDLRRRIEAWGGGSPGPARDTPDVWTWREGTVGDSVEALVLTHRESTTTVAVVGPADDRVFPVRFLTEDPDLLREARRELTYYLVELGEPDPWAYARYHCSTMSNIYARIAWSARPSRVGS